MPLIQDSMTLSGRIPARPPAYPEVRFTYRPALTAEVYRSVRAIRQSPEDEWKADAQMICEHVLSWDVQVVAADGKTPVAAPISEAILARLPHPVFQQILAHVQTYAVTEQEKSEKN